MTAPGEGASRAEGAPMTAPGEGASRAEGAPTTADGRCRCHLEQVTTVPARAIRAHSIVRLPDGRIGYLEKNTGTANPWVVIEPGKTAVEIKRATHLEVIQNPLDLALAWMKNYLDAKPGKEGIDDHDWEP